MMMLPLSRKEKRARNRVVVTQKEIDEEFEVLATRMKQVDPEWQKDKFARIKIWKAAELAAKNKKRPKKVA